MSSKKPANLKVIIPSEDSGDAADEELNRTLTELNVDDQPPADQADSVDGGCVSHQIHDMSDLIDQAGASGGDQNIPDREAYSPTVLDVVAVAPARELRDGPKVYRMQDNPRGFCIIVNNIKFDNSRFDDVRYEDRYGSENEGPHWKNTFRQLGFEVIYHENLSASKVPELFEHYSKQVDIAHNAFVGVILSHGHPGVIVGSDSHTVKVDEILTPFNNQECPLLEGKPKLFFIQACRGGELFCSDCRLQHHRSADREDLGAISPFNTSDAGRLSGDLLQVSHPATRVVPTWTDMVICYATVYGYVANRALDTGSWFGDAMLSVINERSCDTELHEMFMLVNRKLAGRISRTPGQIGKPPRKQSTEIVYRGWQKKFYFNPGIYQV